MKKLKLNKKEAESIFKSLSINYRIIAPIEKKGSGRFSDTNLITYDKTSSLNDIVFSKKTYFSAKSVLFPIRETLFEFEDTKTEETKDELSPTIIFLRACDINAFSVMDNHFLKNGNNEDTYYKRRRQLVKFFLIECEEPFSNCFCVSLGTNTTEDYSAFVRKTQDGYEIKIKDDELARYFNGSTKTDIEPRFVKKDPHPIDLPFKINVSLFDNKLWKEYSIRCSACGRCNTSCPTCTCFTIQDMSFNDKKTKSTRKRIWSSCQVKNFAILAGNHDFRVPKGDRMRYKVLHKIDDFKKRNGINMCVGCGRCDDVCPDYISMFKCIEKINQIIGEG